MNDDCTYSFSASLVEDTTQGGLRARRSAGAATDADGIPDAAVTLTTDAANCAPGGKITWSWETPPAG